MQTTDYLFPHPTAFFSQLSTVPHRTELQKLIQKKIGQLSANLCFNAVKNSEEFPSPVKIAFLPEEIKKRLLKDISYYETENYPAACNLLKNLFLENRSNFEIKKILYLHLTEKFSYQSRFEKAFLAKEDSSDISNFISPLVTLEKKVLCVEELEDALPVPERNKPRRMRVETYEDVLVNLSAEQRTILEASMARLPQQEEILADIATSIANNTLLQSRLFTRADFQLYALLALRRGFVDGTAFTTCILFSNQYRMTHPSEIKRVKLFGRYSLNPVARELIAQSAFKYSGQKGFDPDDGSEKSRQTFLNEDQLATFWRLMRQQPEFEQQFLLVPDRSPPELLPHTLRTVTHRLGHIGYNVFMHVKTADGPMMMIASKSMCQLYLYAQNETSAPDLNACFLLSTEERIVEQLVTNQHDMYLDCDFFAKAETIDKLPARPEVQAGTKHDVYHAQVLLDIPLEIRKRFYHLSKLFREIAKKFHDIPHLEAIAKEFAFSIGEGEHRIYEDVYHSATKVAKIAPAMSEAQLSALHHRLALSPQIFWKAMSIQLNRTYLSQASSDLPRTVAIYCLKTFLKTLLVNEEQYKQLGIPVMALYTLTKEKNREDNIFLICLKEVMKDLL